jgi:2',3'-cyclic-nucleotide 2'-phosphodiesterase/3'-nucleotidase
MPILLNRRAFLATTAGFIAMHPFSVRAQAGQAHLRIMETTDIHVHIFPYDYYGDRPVDTVGLARTASLIEGIRAESTNSILLDNGDFLQGNPMGDYMAYERGMSEGDVHPMIAAMNTLGFDASTLGNHEFNYGLPFLMNSVAGRGLPRGLRQRLDRDGRLRNRRHDSGSALRDARQDPDRRRGRKPPDPHRHHRLRPAPDHDLGPPPP